jgi:DNA-binding MarR family transcriptional regulator
MAVISENPFEIASIVSGIRYSKQIAKEHGIKEAIILQFIAFNATKHKRDNFGSWWFFHSITDIAEHYKGVISRSAVHRIINKLVKNGILIMRRNARHRTTSYAFVDDEVRKICLAESDPIYFDIEHAKIGIAEAILINNISYWIIRNKEIDATYKWHPIPVSSRQMIYRALEKLIELNILIENNGTYSFADENQYIEQRTKGYVAHNQRVAKTLETLAYYHRIEDLKNCLKWDDTVQDGTTIIDRRGYIRILEKHENRTNEIFDGLLDHSYGKG